MKAVLVIDIPDYVDFNICKTVDVGLCFNVKEYTEPFIKSNVPLKPLPNAITERGKWISEEYQKGWNAFRENLEK
jgi:hypothetical protein